MRARTTYGELLISTLLLLPVMLICICDLFTVMRLLLPVILAQPDLSTRSISWLLNMNFIIMIQSIKGMGYVLDR
jgi:hypothetical protein